MDIQYVIGVDMGGTNTAIGIVDARGAILCRNQIDTGGYDTGKDYVKALGVAINELIEKNHLQGKVKGIGMGAPDGNMNAGTLEHAANIPWAKTVVVPIAALLTEATGLPCKLTNDANAAALGEMAYGAAKGMKDFMVITLGTGLGSGIVAGGQLVVGHDGFAGELGHVRVVRQNGRLCGCGRSGCLETYASATGVARTVRELLELYPERKSLLRDITYRPVTSKDVFEAAEKGDALALEIFDFTGRMLGDAFADFITFSSPQAIILFGGLAHAGKYLLKPLQDEMDKQILTMYKGKTKIIVSQLNDAEAAILGASALAWE
ncbi:MAG: ROK family protein [Dysgonamonadaceae bacterium]|jgi:glucokinase|nr:ROK family protein [Dysgonamonadaceae bacterium]